MAVFGGTEEENLARSTYSGYNAGTGVIWRHRTKKSEAKKYLWAYDILENGYDKRDMNFRRNYLNTPWER